MSHYGYTRKAEECANCDEQVAAALRFDEIGEAPPEILELECGHIWRRVTLADDTEIEASQ